MKPCNVMLVNKKKKHFVPLADLYRFLSGISTNYTPMCLTFFGLEMRHLVRNTTFLVRLWIFAVNLTRPVVCDPESASDHDEVLNGRRALLRRNHEANRSHRSPTKTSAAGSCVTTASDTAPLRGTTDHIRLPAAGGELL